MSLRNFDTVLDAPGAQRAAIVARPATPPVEVLTEVASHAQPSAARAFLVKGDESWTWQDLRDYVVAEIERLHGVFPRDPRKEAGIFKSFLSRYPDSAVAIARYAFDVREGYWAGAPISVNRFCKASDRFFADVITERIVQAPVEGW